MSIVQNKRRSFRQSGNCTLDVRMVHDPRYNQYIVEVSSVKHRIDGDEKHVLIDQTYQRRADAEDLFESVIAGVLPLYREVGNELVEDE